MRKVALLGAGVALLLGLGGALAASATSQAAESGSARTRTLTFDVVFSPFSLVAANNERDPSSPIALGDEIVFHDQLFSRGKEVGDEVGSCVVAAVAPEILANCGGVVRLPGGNITFQFPNAPGPEPKELAVTGGTGAHRSVGGEGTLVEFGNGKGKLTLHLLYLAPRGGGA
jgi:hypothetical protein